jgi:hypothetical protein
MRSSTVPWQMSVWTKTGWVGAIGRRVFEFDQFSDQIILTL